MANEEVTRFAGYLRTVNRNSPFSISTSLLISILNTLESMEEVQSSSTSFHVRQGSSNQMEHLLDLQFLCNFFEQTKSLKIYSDGRLREEIIDLSKFKNLMSLEIQKVDINLIKGIQKVRSQLQSLVCRKTSNNLEDILVRCGADDSHAYLWTELKKGCFTNNDIVELDRSFESTTWLHTLDLSHNRIKDVQHLNCLINLKHLNLAYNDLKEFPQLSGQICNRLQTLVLKNNFIEDLSGLQALTNISVLDLTNNTLFEHKSLSALSHLLTLQCLTLEENPLSHHPHHRQKTASYLHSNISVSTFVLDGQTLSKSEKKLIGCFHPIQRRVLTPQTSQIDVMSTSTDRIRKSAREVNIEEEESSIVKQNAVPILTPTSNAYLETKKQIENLREQYGESWLNKHSGLLVQNALGIEGSSVPVSSSPYEADFLLHSSDFRPKELQVSPSNKPDTNGIAEASKSEAEADVAADVTNKAEASFTTAYDTTQFADDESSTDDSSDYEENEEGLYMVVPEGETEHIFIVLTEKHIMEKDLANKERMKWHINSVITCQALDVPTKIQLDFETMRKDKKQRVYNLQEDCVEKFVSSIQEKITKRAPAKSNDIKYQCMKCSHRFMQVKSSSVLSEAPAVTCPSCDSTLVVEE